MPNFTILNDCLDLLTLHVDNLSLYNPEHSSLLDNKEKIFEYHIVDFRKELNQNILQASGTEQKQDIITWYISELMRSLNHKPITADPILEAAKTSDPATAEQPGLRKKEILILDLPVDSRNEERFLQGCNILYHLIFNELQTCCVRAKIPFLKICMQLQYPVKTINTSISKSQTKKKAKKTSPLSRVKKITGKLVIPPTPVFYKSVIPEILDIMVGYFSKDHFEELSSILSENGNSKDKLLFKGKANQLVDLFRVLYKNKIITGCKIEDLAGWIENTFEYLKHGKDVTKFDKLYNIRLLRSGELACKNPILAFMDNHVIRPS